MNENTLENIKRKNYQLKRNKKNNKSFEKSPNYFRIRKSSKSSSIFHVTV